MGNVVSIAAARAIANGAIEVKSFKGGVRSDELNTLEAGDRFVIPTDYKVYEQKVGTGNNVAQYIIVEVNGVAKNFYPSSVTKNFAIAKENGELTGQRAKTSGTFCDWFKKNGTVDAAMRAAAGHEIEVTNVTPYLRRVFGSTTETQTTGVMSIDWVGEPAADPTV